MNFLSVHIVVVVVVVVAAAAVMTCIFGLSLPTQLCLHC